MNKERERVKFSDIIQRKDLFPHNIKGVSTRDWMAYAMASGLLLFMVIFTGVVFVAWALKAPKNTSSISIYIKWIALVGKDIFLPILTLLLGYLFGTREKG